MATETQREAARRNVRARRPRRPRRPRTLAHQPKQTRTALGQQGAAVAQRNRTGETDPKTRPQLYGEAGRRNLPGRSKTARAELARVLGER